ncbi:hypothetical protein [Oceanospirillum sediminis]|uniref:Uncharacterized protein n=1 Tax=Oceanospirillum sediminis TaxID=2760088 RepID=A0A839IVY6_9GAMM|nr:hypothetical protein [Oceanospirillum sediminis]MBB1489593.1 hypothetical protein [Oceanospirillum sediminis]
MKTFCIDPQSYQIHREFCTLAGCSRYLGGYPSVDAAIQFAQLQFGTEKVHACYFCSKDYFS